jgi:hypothetical protein
MKRHSAKLIAVFILCALAASGCKKKPSSDSGDGASGGDDLMVYMLPDTNSLDFENVEKLMAAPKLKPRIEKEFNNSARFALLKTAGLSAQDVQHVLDGNGRDGRSITVIRLKKSIEKARITAGATELKAGETTFWKMGKVSIGKAFVAFPKDNIVLMAQMEDDMKAILNKDRKVLVPEALLELAGKVSGGAHWRAQVRSKDAGQFEPPGPDAEAVKAMMNARGSATRMEISGHSVVVTNLTLCENSAAASKVVEYQTKKMAQQKGRIDLELGGGKERYTPAQKEAIRKAIFGVKLKANGSYVESVTDLNLEPFGDADNLPGGLF